MEQAFQALLDEWKGVKGNVIPLLQKTQALYGFLPMDAMQKIARVTGKTPSEVYGVATFYAQFRFTPMGKHVVKVCHGTACHVQGADSLDTVAGNQDRGQGRGDHKGRRVHRGARGLPGVLLPGARGHG